MTTQYDDLIAEEIAEELLYRTGRALLEGVLEGVEDRFTLPHSLETTEGARIVRTPDDIHGIFREVRAYFAETGVVNMVRTVVEAKFISEAEIEAVHVSRIWRRGEEQPGSTYPVFCGLKLCDDGKWRIANSNYAITDSRRFCSALLSWRTKAET